MKNEKGRKPVPGPPDEFRTIRAEAVAGIRVEGSRFTARAFPSDSRAGCEAILDRVRKEHHDASHRCYAYRIGTSGDLFRYNDDGEPGATAGRPILGAIDQYKLTNLIVIVVRYFGGTKLGMGGLVRAYGGAAAESLKNAEIVTRFDAEVLTASFPHPQTGNVMALVARTGMEIQDTEYDEEVHLRLRVRRLLKDSLINDLMNITGGNIRIRE